MKFISAILFIVLTFTIPSCTQKDISTEINKQISKTLKSNSKDLFDVKISSFSLKSQVPGNETVTCYYTRPYKKDGTLAPRADTVVYYGHYPMEKNYYKISARGIFINLARRSGFTVFSVDFANSPISRKISDPKSFYYYPQSGAFKTLLKAYDKIIKKENISPVKLFLTGLSGGSSMSVNFINTYPEKVDALALFAGHRYLNHIRKNSAAWLIQYTLNSHTQEKNISLFNDLSNMGKYPIIVETMPDWNLRGRSNFNHCENWNANKMRQIFLEDVSDLRRQNNNIMPSEANWPYVISLSNKSKLLENNNNRLNLKDPLYMPSKRFHQEYMNLISPPTIIKLPNNNKMNIGTPNLFNKKEKGIMINLTTSKSNTLQTIDYDARFFSENGYFYFTTTKPSELKIFKNIIAKEFTFLSKTAPLYIISDKMNFDNNKNAIIYCNSKSHFEKMKSKIENHLKNRIKIAIIANTKQLYNTIIQELKPDKNSLLSVFFLNHKLYISEKTRQKRNELLLDIINSSRTQTYKRTTLSPR